MKRFVPLFSASIFLSLHYAATLYVNSSFLASFFSAQAVGLLFVAGALINLLFFILAPFLIKHLGARPFFLFFTTLTITSCIGLAYPQGKHAIETWFLIYSAALPMIYYSLDIFLEDISTTAKTGGIRGAYLTGINAAIALAPLCLALFAKGENVSKVYLASLFLLLPIFPLFFYFEEPHFRPKLGVSLPVREWWQKVNIRYSTFSRLILELFYAVMVIYTPLYLHEIIGFSWTEVGIMFAIMLLPFIIFEWPVGILADRWYGEKEFMAAGFFLAGLALLFMPFIGKSFWYWTFALFVSRIGASFVEITTEVYFFKKVSADDRGLIALFWMSRPIALILGALLGAVTLSYIPMENIFFLVAIVMVFGLVASTRLRDTL